ncbi:C2H2 type zinc-finger-domain-containing protein [Chlamydoabsidia padenii]|nr:C2H2 type zinc-finger-domain-containing protein [Chlamydoabsidia padenii]
MSLTQTLPTTAQTFDPAWSKFTCISCQMAFSSSENQRAHYRTDWHKYNLKRKMAELAPVTSYQFNEKVLAQQAKGKEESEQDGIVYHCYSCRKTFGSEPSYDNHIRSKKHKDSEANQTVSSSKSTLTPKDNDDGTSCLFCDEHQHHFDDTLHHMSKHHGFFLPDIEYLSDVHGLINYLSNKIRSEFNCLYCNKGFKTAQATMAHMIDKGHCKMAYDDTEDVDTLLQYYDFDIQTSDNESMHATTRNGELMLQNGTRLGNRHLAKFYRQQHQHRSTTEHQGVTMNPQGDTSTSLSVSNQRPESLAKNRKERRHMAITDGQVEQQKRMTTQGICEVALKHDQQSHINVKQNEVNLSRFRTQNPI